MTSDGEHVFRRLDTSGRKLKRPVPNKKLQRDAMLEPVLGDQVLFDSCVLEMIKKLGKERSAQGLELRLFVNIGSRANRNTGACYPATGTLACDMGVTVQAVRRALRRLEQRGFIHTDHMAGPNGTNVYYLDFNGCEISAQYGEPRSSGTLDSFYFGEPQGSGAHSTKANPSDWSAGLGWDDV